MNKWFNCVCFVGLVFFMSGCATIMTGPVQKVSVTSAPSGAVATVDGGQAAVTPTIFTLERKSDHTIEIAKEGYRTATVALRHTLSGATAGNLIVGGIIGIAIDASSGAMYKLVPEQVDVTLEKAE
ncbi:MAG: PEGA domain-containing protein [Candidatus Omnitrophota bacterium]